MSTKRFLNVVYKKPARIDTMDMDDISQFQKEILLAFREITVGYGSVQLWNKNTNPHTLMDDLDDIKALPEQYFWKAKLPGALFLNVQLLPSASTSTGSKFTTII